MSAGPGPLERSVLYIETESDLGEAQTCQLSSSCGDYATQYPEAVPH